MKKRGMLLASIGLIAGLAFGLGIQHLKHRIADQLRAMLDDEARTSAGCEFKSKSVQISLLSLRAIAREPAIVCNGVPKLAFKKIRANFSLAKIREHQILLSKLELFDGDSDGFGPASATYKFINSLAAPLPPERDYPGRWKLKMQRLEMTSSVFHETFSFGEIRAEGAELVVKRTPDSNFMLAPHIRELKLVRKDSEPATTFPLGDLSTDLLLTDDFVSFENFVLKLKDALLQATFRSELKGAEALNGKANFQVDSASVGLPSQLKFNLKGESALAGSLGAPRLDATIEGSSTIGLGSSDKAPQIDFQNLSAHFVLGSENGSLTPSLRKLEASSAQNELSVTTPLQIKNGTLSGSFDLAIGELRFAGVGLHQLRLKSDLGGSTQQPQLHSTGVLGALETAGYRFGPLGLEFLLDPNAAKFNLRHSSAVSGNFSLDGNYALKHPSSGLRALNLNFDQYHPQFIESAGASSSSLATINGSLQLAPSEKDGELSGGGDLQISFLPGLGEHLELSVLLQAGSLSAQLTNAAQSLTGGVHLDLLSRRKSSFELTLKNFALQSDTAADACSSISSNLAYSFDTQDAWSGNGELKITQLRLGCEPYTISIPSPQSIQIQSGALILPNFVLRGPGSELVGKGQISLKDGYALRADGEFNLAALIALVPSVDNLSGKISLHSALSGAIESPLFSGEATLQDGEFSLESANTAATDVHATLRMQGESWRLDQLTGMINDGNFKVTGQLFPFDFERSTLQARLNNILIEPADNISLAFSGDLSLHQQERSRPVLSGTIEIENAEVQRNIDVTTFLKAALGFVLPSVKNASSEALPDLDLDLAIGAQSNIFVLTNWLGAEFSADLRVSGSLNDPKFDGELETLNGWFGFRERRFDINSGSIRFKPTSREPFLEMISESSVHSISGDNLLVILEARGPLSSPKITLSSDSGLPQREILSLLTSTGNLPGTTKIGDAKTGIQIGEIPILRDDSAFIVGRFLRNLTTVDSLVLEPTYNVQRGSIEPTIIATKTLSDRLALIGESFFGSNVTESNLKLRLALSEALSLTGIASVDSSKDNAALGADLAYSIWVDRRRTLELVIDGNHSFENSEIRKALRLGELSVVVPSETPRLEQILSKFYLNQGFFSFKSRLTCHEQDGLCSELEIAVEEGPRYHTDALVLEGDALDPQIEQRLFKSFKSGAVASKEELDLLVADLTAELRSEGFISARVRAEYIASDQPEKRNLKLKIKTGNPVTFNFSGNTVYSAEEFLETINLFKRKQPFGNNTINILIQNIERKYREGGYLFVSIRFEKNEDAETKRTTYLISIEEGSRIPVDHVFVDSETEVTSEKLKELVYNLRTDIAESILSPKYALEEEIESNARIIQDLMIEHGYPDALVSYSIDPDPSAQSVIIRYIVRSGEENLVRNLNLQGLPEHFNAPATPKLPAATGTINIYIETLLEALRERGYRTPQFETSLDPDTATLNVALNSGALTRISAIRLEAPESVDRAVIMRNLEVKEGEAWDEERIASTRRRLLKLGLFTRVEIVPQDGEVNSEAEVLQIKLGERRLRTLQVGAGLNSEYGLHLFGEATDRALFSDGRSLSFRLDGYYDSADADVSQAIASLKYADPYFLQSEYSLVEDLRYQKFDITTQEFNLDRISLASYLFRSWENGLSLSSGHTLLQEDLSDVSSDAILSDLDEGLVRLSFLSASLGWDRRDNPLNPISGYNLNFNFQASAEELGSDANYYTFGSKFSFILPLRVLGPRFSLANNTRADWGFTFWDTVEIPISQRFYLGGRTTVRGFDENSLGPLGEEGSVIGGDTLFSDNLEFRYLLGESTSLLTFLDSGKLFLRGADYQGDDLRLSTGVGVRYLSPIGPIGIDLGHPLDRHNGESNLRLHFNIGANF